MGSVRTSGTTLTSLPATWYGSVSMMTVCQSARCRRLGWKGHPVDGHGHKSPVKLEHEPHPGQEQDPGDKGIKSRLLTGYDSQFFFKISTYSSRIVAT